MDSRRSQWQVVPSIPKKCSTLPRPSIAPASASRSNVALSSTEYRVGMPPVRPLPLENSYCASDIADAFLLEELYVEVAYILTAHGIRQTKGTPDDAWETMDDVHDSAWEPVVAHPPPICLVSRSDPRTPNSARWTLLITAIWDSSSRQPWEDSVRAIRPVVDCFLPGYDVDVEMIATYLTTPRRLGPVGHNPELHDIWDRLSGEIEDVLQGFKASRDTLTVISVFRMGFGPVDENPVTVYIAVDYNCPEYEWPPIIAALRGILDPVGLELFFEHNLWQPYTFKLNPPGSTADPKFHALKQPYEVRPNLGADIGAAQYLLHDGQERSPPLGTLGCYVDVKTKQGDWKKMALTNYHVCRPCIPGFTLTQNGNEKSKPGRPVPGSQLQQYDRGGFGPAQARQLPYMEHPSRSRHNHTMVALQGTIDKKKGNATNGPIVAKMTGQLSAHKVFFDNSKNLLGKLWAGSGFDRRSNINSVLDWALIEVDQSRQGTNLLPGFDAWAANHYQFDFPDAEGMTKLKMYQNNTILGQQTAKVEVFKYGASTGPTIGIFSGLKSRIGIPIPGANPSKSSGSSNKKLSLEYVVERRDGDQQFAEPGDSGAMVFDNFGHALGLVFKSLSPNICGGSAKGYLTVVISIDQIFDDIKRFTGATEVRVADD